MNQLFTKEQAPRRKPIKRMHVVDAGCDPQYVHFVCGYCGYDDDWKYHEGKTITELKLGIPCPVCNEGGVHD